MALALFVSACSLGDDDEAQQPGEQSVAGEQSVPAETGPDVEALRAAWAEEVGVACTGRDEQIETLARELPGVVEEDGLAAAAERFAPVEETMVESLAQAEAAPGDEAQAQEMAALYQEAGELRIQALQAKYVKRDRQFYALMEQSEAAREEADAIAAELGAETCASEAPGPYSTVDGLAAVRWGDRASTLCRERDRAFMSFRPTDIAAFDAASRRWLRQMRALKPPEQYARKIDRFLDQYVASERAHDEGLNAKGNRLSAQSTRLMYDIGFEIGFMGFCSAKPA